MDNKECGIVNGCCVNPYCKVNNPEPHIESWHIFKEDTGYCVKFVFLGDGRFYAISPYYENRLEALVHAVISGRFIRARGFDVNIIR